MSPDVLAAALNACSPLFHRAEGVMGRPILFSAPMLRALLAGTKTQTRRILKPQPELFETEPGKLCEVGVWPEADGKRPRITLGRCITRQTIPCAVGDRLWVKETWRPVQCIDPWDIEVIHNANGEHRVIRDGEFGERDWTMPKAAARGNVSPLFMPRWASRLTLTVTDVHVHQINDIKGRDIIAEGVRYDGCHDTGHSACRDGGCFAQRAAFEGSGTASTASAASPRTHGSRPVRERGYC